MIVAMTVLAIEIDWLLVDPAKYMFVAPTSQYLRCSERTRLTKCVASLAFGNGRERLKSRPRSALSPWLDCRNEFDKARDRITELAE